MDTKNWWQSKTIWTNVVAGLFGLLALFHVGLPADVTQEQVIGGIMAAVGFVNIVLRFFTKKPIAATPA